MNIGFTEKCQVLRTKYENQQRRQNHKHEQATHQVSCSVDELLNSRKPVFISSSANPICFNQWF